MKPIHPLGIIMLMLLVFVPREKNEQPQNVNPSPIVVITVPPSSRGGLEATTVVPGEPVKETEFAVSK